MGIKFQNFTNDKSRISAGLPSTSPWSVSFWVRPDISTAVFRPWFYRCNNAATPFAFVGLDNTGALHISNGLVSASGFQANATGVVLPIGRWYHSLVTFNYPDMLLYLDGVLTLTATASGGTVSATNDMLMFGNDDDSDAETGLCTIAAVKFWSKKSLLKKDVLEERYEAFAITNKQFLYCECPFEYKGHGYDYSGNGKHWTMTGGYTAENPPLVNFRRTPVSFRAFPWNVQTTSTVFTASGTPSIGAATCSGSATFAPGTKTATGTPSIGHATAAGSATFSPGTHTATGSPSIGHATASGAATFSPGTHTASGSPSIGHATASGAATFNAPVYTATGAPSVGHATAAGVGTTTGPTFTGAGAFVVKNASCLGAATFAAGTKTATGTPSIGHATANGSATFAAGTKTASGSLLVNPATCIGSASFFVPATWTAADSCAAVI